jgi:hypothetical protein
MMSLVSPMPGRTARSRTSSTVVRVGSMPSDTSLRSVRETISRPLNGATVTCIGSCEWLTARRV